VHPCGELGVGQPDEDSVGPALGGELVPPAPEVEGRGLFDSGESLEGEPGAWRRDIDLNTRVAQARQLLGRPAAAIEAEVAEEFIGQYYSASPAVPR
jgi:hypothetical protein